MGVVLAGGLSGRSTHKPRGQDMKRVYTALGYDAPLSLYFTLAMLGCLPFP